MCLRFILLINISIAFLFSSVSYPQNNWELQDSNTGSWLTCVNIVNPDIAWAAGDSGIVIRTTNGGYTWTRVGQGTNGITERINVIDAIDSSTAFIVTPYFSSTITSIYRTSDGGRTWSKVYFQNGGFINGLRMLNSKEGVAYGNPVGGKWTILKTTNGGISWARIKTEPGADSSEESSDYNSLNIIDPVNYIFASNKKVYQTTDAGITWSSFKTPLTFSDMYINKIGIGVATTNYAGKTAQTTDFGKTWTINDIQTIGYQVSGAGTKDFWIAGDYTGQGYGLFRSSNSGQSWNLDYTSYYQYLYALDFITIENKVFGFATGVFGEIIHYSGIITSIKTEESHTQLQYNLIQNYPNPFNSSTIIVYSIPKTSFVILNIYDILGRKIETLVSEEKIKGSYKIKFDASKYNSGIYFYTLHAGLFSQTKKLILLK